MPTTKPQLIAFETSFQADLSAAGPIFWMGTLVGFVVGMLISYQVIYTDLADQLPQYATLKGMGYGTGYLVRIVFEQAALSAIGVDDLIRDQHADDKADERPHPEDWPGRGEDGVRD